MNKNILIVGAGITGLVLAERFASYGYAVKIIEKRNHIGGNCFDSYNRDRILIHNYGPHIFHTNYEEVWEYLSKFTEWIPYEHRVQGFIDGKFMEIPFNVNSLYSLYSEKKARLYEKKLIDLYGKDKRVPILEMMKSDDRDIKNIAEFVYEKIFLHYTVKQWGLKPDQIDPKVTARVPVITSRDNRYFKDKYQAIPKKGYTEIFKQMIEGKDIKITYLTDFKREKDKLNYDILFFTGPIDEFFGFKYGRLGYRRAYFEFETVNTESYQPLAVINYPGPEFAFTRITEFKKLSQQKSDKTTIAREYPGERGFVSWPIASEKNLDVYRKYKILADRLASKNIFFVGRLAEFKYYDMDDAVKRSLEMFKGVIKKLV